MNQNKIIFLGTNGWFDDSVTGHTLSILIQCKDYDIILDAGSGFTQINKYYSTIGEKPTYLFLSHVHLDHIIGLHTPPKYNFKKGLNIIIADNWVDTLKNIISPPYSIELDSLGYDINFVEVPQDMDKLPFNLEIAHVKHSIPTIAGRFTLDSKVITFVTDTGICDNAIKLAHNSDILIAECTHRLGETNPEWPHMNPEEAAQLALESNAKKLILTHFDASKYKNMKSRKFAEQTARKIFPNTIASYDGMRFEFSR